jgi:hypothetical protein
VLKDKLKVGLRAQDFHESLKIVGSFGPKDVHFKKTLLVGKAASLAMHLRGLLYIDDLQLLEYAASSLGISSLELPMVLHELEAVDFVKVVRAGSQFKRLEIKIPEFRSGYEELGERWLLLKPGEIEQAAIVTLDQLYSGPTSVAKLIGAENLSSPEFAMMRDVMQSGQLLAVQPVDGQPTAFTPLAVDANPLAYLQWAHKFPNEVQQVLKTLEANQGIAISDPKIVNNIALGDAIQTGVLMPVQVSGATGDQQFVFAPKGGLRPEERTILDKARAILACVRYGQRFAKGRPIRYPRRILETLSDLKHFKRGHPDLFSQYGLLVEKLIGHPFEEGKGSGRWNFQVDDTDVNMKAFQVAIEMLTIGESPSAHIDLEAQKALLGPSGYLGPPATRPRLVKYASASAETRTEMIKQMARLARGMSTHD